jgi:hypothetical protein
MPVCDIGAISRDGADPICSFGVTTRHAIVVIAR